MTLDLVVAAVAAVAALALVPALVALRHNLRALRLARRTSPLAHVDLGEATVRELPAPSSWPPVEGVTDPREAAAYAALAHDRALTYVLGGEMLALAGGAAFGAMVPDLLTWSMPGMLALPAFVAVIAVGIAVRALADRRWEVIRLRYLDRYDVLTAAPGAEPAAPPRKTRGLLGWLCG